MLFWISTVPCCITPCKPFSSCYLNNRSWSLDGVGGGGGFSVEGEKEGRMDSLCRSFVWFSQVGSLLWHSNRCSSCSSNTFFFLFLDNSAGRVAAVTCFWTWAGLQCCSFETLHSSCLFFCLVPGHDPINNAAHRVYSMHFATEGLKKSEALKKITNKSMLTWKRLCPLRPGILPHVTTLALTDLQRLPPASRSGLSQLNYKAAWWDLDMIAYGKD